MRFLEMLQLFLKLGNSTLSCQSNMLVAVKGHYNGGVFVMDHKLIKVGRYNIKFNEILGIEMDELNIYRSKGLPAHMLKSKHDRCLKYIDYIPDIIECPDYIGINPNEKAKSIELIKRYRDNVMIGIKLDADKGYLYVSTMHEIQEKKIERRLFSGRIKKFSVDNTDKK